MHFNPNKVGQIITYTALTGAIQCVPEQEQYSICMICNEFLNFFEKLEFLLHFNPNKVGQT